MITKKEIKVSGLNPDDIEILGEAIAKEGRKDAMDFSYILEKTGEIERFIRDVEEDMRRQEEDERGEEKVKENKGICKYCEKEYDKDEIVRIYGEMSNVSLLGYCSAQCYTKDTVGRDEVMREEME